MKSLFSKVMIVGFLFLLAGCQISEEEAIEASKNAFLDSFASEESNEANYESEQVEFYLPSEMEVTEEIDFNIQFEKDNQIFLLFFIPVEPWDSGVHFIRDKEFETDAVVFEQIEEAGKLGYLVISPEEEGSFKVVVGMGGAKITTISTVGDLAESTKVMTEVLHSIEYKD